MKAEEKSDKGEYTKYTHASKSLPGFSHCQLSIFFAGTLITMETVY